MSLLVDIIVKLVEVVPVVATEVVAVVDVILVAAGSSSTILSS